MPVSDRKIRVAVVFGGRSSEHAISCITAGSVMAAIDPARYEVVPIGIARDGRWVLATGSQQFAIEGGRLPEVDKGRAIALPFDSRPSELGLTTADPGDVPATLGDVDVVLPLMHGVYGEDGTIQGLLELAGIRYVGAGVLASAVSMDKAFMKIVCEARGLRPAPYLVVKKRDWHADRQRILDEVEKLGWPVFIKPARAGSSIGVSKVQDVADLEAAVEAAQQHDPKVLIEAAVDGVEIECGVLEGMDGRPPDTSLPVQIRYSQDRDFYDFETKYLDDRLQFDIPPDLPESVIKEIQWQAAAAFEALECEGLARVDFFYTPDGRVVFNEINTMPGFTPASAFPKMWEASGIDYPALVDRLIQTALRRSTGLR